MGETGRVGGRLLVVWVFALGVGVLTGVDVVDEVDGGLLRLVLALLDFCNLKYC